MLKSLSGTFITGLITILPVTLTIYLFYWLAISAETILGNMIKWVLPNHLYWPGMGVIAGLVVVFFTGLLMHAYVVQRLFSRGEQVLYHLPLIKSIYRAIRDFFNFFSPKQEKEFDQVVSVALGNGMTVLGFVTQAREERLPPGLRRSGCILVYIPMSYMIGGFTVLIPRSDIVALDMSMDEAMRFTLTAGITGKSDNGTD